MFQHNQAHKVVATLDTRLGTYERDHDKAKIYPQLYLLIVRALADISVSSFFSSLGVNTPVMQIAELSAWFNNVGLVPTYGQPLVST